MDRFIKPLSGSVKVLLALCFFFCLFLLVCSMFTVVLTGFTFNVFSHPCHFQQRVALSSGVAACWWAATSQEKQRLHVSRVVWGCAVFSVMSFFIYSLTANNTISSSVFVFCKPSLPNIRTCTNVLK